jgi:hypothetical protein
MATVAALMFRSFAFCQGNAIVISVIPQGKVFHSWDPIPLNVAIRTTNSQQAAGFVLTTDWERNLCFTIFEAKTNRVLDEVEWPLADRWLQTATLSVNGRQTLEKTVLLNEWYTFPQGGEYLIVPSIRNVASGYLCSGKAFDIEMETNNDDQCGVALGAFRDQWKTLSSPTTSEQAEERDRRFFGLAYSGSPVVVSYLREVASDENIEWDYRRTALIGLGRVKGFDGVRCLVDIVQRDPRVKLLLTRYAVVELLRIQNRTTDAEIRRTIQEVDGLLKAEKKRESGGELHALPNQ